MSLSLSQTQPSWIKNEPFIAEPPCYSRLLDADWPIDPVPKLYVWKLRSGLFFGGERQSDLHFPFSFAFAPSFASSSFLLSRRWKISKLSTEERRLDRRRRKNEITKAKHVSPEHRLIKWLSCCQTFVPVNLVCSNFNLQFRWKFICWKNTSWRRCMCLSCCPMEDVVFLR